MIESSIHVRDDIKINSLLQEIKEYLGENINDKLLK